MLSLSFCLLSLLISFLPPDAFSPFIPSRVKLSLRPSFFLSLVLLSRLLLLPVSFHLKHHFTSKASAIIFFLQFQSQYFGHNFQLLLYLCFFGFFLSKREHHPPTVYWWEQLSFTLIGWPDLHITINTREQWQIAKY